MLEHGIITLRDRLGLRNPSTGKGDPTEERKQKVGQQIKDLKAKLRAVRKERKRLEQKEGRTGPGNDKGCKAKGRTAGSVA